MFKILVIKALICLLSTSRTSPQNSNEKLVDMRNKYIESIIKELELYHNQGVINE